MKINISKDKEIIVFTGPESSGKTTCSERVAKINGLTRVKEYAREYLQVNGLSYTYEDIKKIAIKQLELEKIAHQNNSLIICDTDLATLEIWSIEKFGISLELKDDLFAKKHYLLCYPDIPWEPDPLRENPEDRIRLFEVYQAYFTQKKLSYSILYNKERENLSLGF